MASKFRLVAYIFNSLYYSRNCIGEKNAEQNGRSGRCRNDHDVLPSYYERIRMRDAWRSHRRVHRGSRGNASFVQYEWMGSGTTRHPVGRTDCGEGRVRLVYAFIFHDRYFKRAPGAHGTKGGDGGEKPRKILRPTLKSESSGRETLRRLLVFAAFIPWTPITPIENDVPRSDPVPIYLICGVLR